MPRKKNKKTALLKKELKKTISEILVANEKDLRPYIEILNFTPENIIQSQMGSLLGVFEIKDDDEDSAYIVNFLSSVAKKEYFANSKRLPEENFESALNKINLALSEIAKHGNIRWMGKIDMAICALEKNNVYFSVTGKAKIILARNGTLMDITQGLAPKGELYPLRTFTDTASGKLKNGDKLIITTGDIFHILPLPEIEKRAFSFSKKRFVQFLKTALINELEIAGTIVADIYEKNVFPIKSVPEKKKQKEGSLENLNAFSEKTFKESPISLSSSDKKTVGEASQENPAKNKRVIKKEYTDKKTGHIYVQGENKHLDRKNNLISQSFWLFTLREKILDICNQIKNDIKNEARVKTNEIISNLKNFKNFLKNWIFCLKDNILSAEKKSVIQKAEKIPINEPSGAKINMSALTKLLPNFSKIKETALQMDYQQKVYAFLIIAAIVILPLIVMVKFKNKNDPLHSTDNSAVQEEFFENKNLAGEKDARFVETVTLYSQPELIGQILTNGNLLLAITDQKIIEVEENQEIKEFLLPPELGKIIYFTLMRDLNLIFLFTDKQKILSFSPISRKFKENDIQLPENSRVSAIAVYLTYVYLADSENSQIYRYPRAEEGFGEKTEWLKEAFDLKNISHMAINGDIYLADGNSLLKFSSGKKQEFNLEESTTPINFNKIFTDNETEHIYVLDNFNGRIVKFSQEGKIITQYNNENMQAAKSFLIDEKGGKVYITTENGEIIYFNL